MTASKNIEKPRRRRDLSELHFDENAKWDIFSSSLAAKSMYYKFLSCTLGISIE